MYKVIDKKEFKKSKQYEWFRTFANPCYGISSKMDVTKVVEYSKKTGTSFFINILYLVTKGLSSVEEMRLREVNNEIRLYDYINPTFTVMTDSGIYENCGFEMIEDYNGFYNKAKEVIDVAKHQTKVKDSFNSNTLFNDYYISANPWLSFSDFVHPIPDNNYESSSCPRIVWDKYQKTGDSYFMTLNITVSHCFVDGYPLATAFKNIQNNFNDIEQITKELNNEGKEK